MLALLDNFFFFFHNAKPGPRLKTYAAVIELACKSFRRAGIRTLTVAIPVHRRISDNWELIIKLVRDIPGIR